MPTWYYIVLAATLTVYLVVAARAIQLDRRRKHRALVRRIRSWT